MEWYVGIIGDSFDLKNLSKSLNSPELCITKIGKDYILKSTYFNSIKKVEDVRNKANEILSLINGSARLVFGMRKSLGSDLIFLVNYDGKIIKHFMLTSGTLYLQGSLKKIRVIKKDGTVQEIFQADPIPEFIAIAQHNKNIAKVLRLLCDRTNDWVNFYRILEVVEEDVGGIPEIKEKGWATKKATERFKHIANSVSAIGDKSRHGRERTELPKDPMTPSEAESLIKTIIYNWIQSKE